MALRKVASLTGATTVGVALMLVPGVPAYPDPILPLPSPSLLDPLLPSPDPSDPLDPGNLLPDPGGVLPGGGSSDDPTTAPSSPTNPADPSSGKPGGKYGAKPRPADPSDPGGDMYPHPPFAPINGNPTAALLQRLYDAQAKQRSLRNQILTAQIDLRRAATAVADAKTELSDARNAGATEGIDYLTDQLAGAVDRRDARAAELRDLKRQLKRANTIVAGFLGKTAGDIESGSNGELLWPLRGTVTSEYGNRYDPYYHTWQLHAGIDIAAPTGTLFHAAAPGRVVRAGWFGGYGNYICVAHGEVRNQQLTTCYGHLTRILVTKGQRVGVTKPLGQVGSTGASTGPHLHFEVRLGGRPTNPRLWL
jgi:murein DD-endopeptidase MepM/ murein hydrolase activator NlpD